MDYGLPTEYDLIVVGTGLVESIVSAAASRIGKRVLHVDNANYYGSIWASFNLDAIHKSLVDTNDSLDNAPPINDVKEGEKLIKIGNSFFGIKDVKQAWHIPEKDPGHEVKLVESLTDITKSVDEVQISEVESNETLVENEGTCLDTGEEAKEMSEVNSEDILPSAFEVISQEKLLKESRKFNIDLAPKLHFARGDFVELLISSNIARYSEFCSVSRVLTWLNGQLEIVPCSRSDVFSNAKVTVIEKRMLMKLLTTILDGNESEFENYKNKTFLEFLKDRKLTPNVLHYVLYAIAMSTEDTPFLEGIKNTRRFLNSLGRFGKTPFLFSLYGSGDITQAFCRLSAVFGGLYALNQELHGLVMDKENNFKALLCGEQRLVADNIVIGLDKAPEDFIRTLKCDKFISRGIFITHRSILQSEREHLSLLVFPPENKKNACIVIEVGYLTRTSPKDYYIVYIFTKQQTNPEEDLRHCVEKLFDFNSEEDTVKPKVLWSLYFSAPDASDLDLRENMPKNVFFCPGPDIDLDYDLSVQKAKEVFKQMYPDLEFLPRAPDPEEIIIGDENDNDTDETDAALDAGVEAEEAVNKEEIKSDSTREP